MTSTLIFSFSIGLSISMLLIERMVGIDWDFHPDVITYVTISDSVAEHIYDTPLNIMNNAHYLWVSFLGSNVGLVVAFNMFFWGITNLILYNSIVDKVKEKGSYFLWGIFILFLFSPYRMHLSTTMLKDTIIILLLTCIFSLRNKWLPIIFLFIWRLAAIFYFINLLSRRLLIFTLFFGLIATYFSFDFIFEYAAKQDEADMQFRDFDLVPAFKEYGIIGTLLRISLWPVIALTGAYAVISPSLFFFPLAIGSISSLILSLFIVSRFNFFSYLQIFLGMALFAFFATGFTTFIRYVYPLISVFPLILLYHETNFKRS
jgi:hypothetical protein